jgi:hypothetical protein
MNSRGFLRLRMLVEFIIAISLAVAAVDVERLPISSHVWLDLPCRLIFAGVAFAIFVDAVQIQRDSRAQ